MTKLFVVEEKKIKTFVGVRQIHDVEFNDKDFAAEIFRLRELVRGGHHDLKVEIAEDFKIEYLTIAEEGDEFDVYQSTTAFEEGTSILEWADNSDECVKTYKRLVPAQTYCEKSNQHWFMEMI